MTRLRSTMRPERQPPNENRTLTCKELLLMAKKPAKKATKKSTKKTTEPEKPETAPTP